MFKERVYKLAPDISPEQVLLDIAEKEFGLARLNLPMAATPIVQRLDSSETVTPTPVNGIHLKNTEAA